MSPHVVEACLWELVLFPNEQMAALFMFLPGPQLTNQPKQQTPYELLSYAFKKTDKQKYPGSRRHVKCMLLLAQRGLSHPPRSPNSLAQSSYSFRPALLTLGLIVAKLAIKSDSPIGRISFSVMCSKASPRDLRGPIAASFANAVISEPEKPV